MGDCQQATLGNELASDAAHTIGLVLDAHQSRLQLVDEVLLAGSALYLSWLPVLLVSGVAFGAVTGVILNVVMPALMNTRFFDKTEKSRKS